MNAGTRVIGYCRVSTVEQGDTRAGLDAQILAIRLECERRQWELVELVEEVASAKSMRRPKLKAALRRLEAGEADALVVAKLDRLSRSTIDFATMLEQAERRGFKLVVLDLGVDMTTPAGEMIATVMAALAQWERRMIGQRTREGLAARRRAGVTLGRPRTLDPAVRELILRAAGDKKSATEIRDILNQAGVPTASGRGTWHRWVVQKIINQGDRQGRVK